MLTKSEATQSIVFISSWWQINAYDYNNSMYVYIVFSMYLHAQTAYEIQLSCVDHRSDAMDGFGWAGCVCKLKWARFVTIIGEQQKQQQVKMSIKSTSSFLLVNKDRKIVWKMKRTISFRVWYTNMEIWIKNIEYKMFCIAIRTNELTRKKNIL